MLTTKHKLTLGILLSLVIILCFITELKYVYERYDINNIGTFKTSFIVKQYSSITNKIGETICDYSSNYECFKHISSYLFENYFVKHTEYDSLIIDNINIIDY